MAQLPLAFGFSPSFGEEDFLIGTPNAEAVAWIDSWPNWSDRILALSGPSGAGKSHLAAIWAARAGAVTLDRHVLSRSPARDLVKPGGALLLDPVPVPYQEEALFHLINLVREQKAFLVLTGVEPPARWKVKLPDLASRLAALPHVAIGEPDDAHLQALLVKLLADRQVMVDPALPDYLARRIERSYAAARDVIAKLDAASLSLHRPITTALARQVLETSRT